MHTHFFNTVIFPFIEHFGQTLPTAILYLNYGVARVVQDCEDSSVPTCSNIASTHDEMSVVNNNPSKSAGPPNPNNSNTEKGERKRYFCRPSLVPSSFKDVHTLCKKAFSKPLIKAALKKCFQKSPPKQDSSLKRKISCTKQSPNISNQQDLKNCQLKNPQVSQKKYAQLSSKLGQQNTIKFSLKLPRKQVLQLSSKGTLENTPKNVNHTTAKPVLQTYVNPTLTSRKRGSQTGPKQGLCTSRKRGLKTSRKRGLQTSRKQRPPKYPKQGPLTHLNTIESLTLNLQSSLKLSPETVSKQGPHTSTNQSTFKLSTQNVQKSPPKYTQTYSKRVCHKSLKQQLQSFASLCALQSYQVGNQHSMLKKNLSVPDLYYDEDVQIEYAVLKERFIKKSKSTDKKWLSKYTFTVAQLDEFITGVKDGESPPSKDPECGQMRVYVNPSQISASRHAIRPPPGFPPMINCEIHGQMRMCVNPSQTCSNQNVLTRPPPVFPIDSHVQSLNVTTKQVVYQNDSTTVYSTSRMASQVPLSESDQVQQNLERVILKIRPDSSNPGYPSFQCINVGGTPVALNQFQCSKLFGV